MEHPKVGELFPEDAISRAKQIFGYLKGGIGAYSDSRGSPAIRKECADYIEARDGYPSNPDVSKNITSNFIQ